MPYRNPNCANPECQGKGTLPPLTPYGIAQLAKGQKVHANCTKCGKNTTINQWNFMHLKYDEKKETVAMLQFETALDMVKRGKRVRRAGWNGKGMWIELRLASEHDPVAQMPYIQIKTADGGIVPWLASQTDLLSVDWEQA